MPWRRRYSFLLLTVAIIAAIGFGIRFINEPAIGAIKVGEPRGDMQPVAKEEMPGRVEGKLISFSYPSEYKPNGNAEVSGRLLERHSFGTMGFGSRSLLVTVEKLTNGGLRESSGYQYRKLNPNLYKFTEYKVAGRTYPMSERLDGGLERILYVENAGYLGIIALSSTTNDEAALMQDLKIVLSDLFWQI